MKLAVFVAADSTKKACEASVENIGLPTARLVTSEGTRPVAAATHAEATRHLAEWLTAHVAPSAIVAVTHRIVHGGPHYHEACVVTDDVLGALHKLTVLDPEHLPIQLKLVEAFRRAFPHASHILCFDTAFHHDLPTRSRLLPVARRYEDEGLRRYGFHGLSYASIVQELRRVEGDVAANGKVIIAHLGSGASLAALHGGKSVDTTMSMTPASGIPMSTRAGDLDPGLALYFEQTQGYDAKRFTHLVNFESGLLGMSETTADMKKLLEIEDKDPRAKDAVDVFCYHVKKTIGGFAAALGGLHTLVFTGGMGENAPKIRSRVCEGLEFLGVTIDPVRNQAGERLISVDGAAVGVHVIHTDEAVTLARETMRLIASKKGGDV